MSQSPANHEPRDDEEREDASVGASPEAPTGASPAAGVAGGEQSQAQTPAEFTDADLAELEEQLSDIETPTEGDNTSAAEEEIAQLKDDLARARADHYNLTQQHNNYVRRARTEQAGARKLGHGDVVDALLPVLDDIDAARAAGALTDGPFAAIASKLEQTLATRFDFTRFGEPGDVFDPAQHEAVMATPSDQVEVETVDQVIQAGYRVGERVIRPAKVIVANPQ